MQVVTMRVVSQKLVKGKVGKLRHARFLCARSTLSGIEAMNIIRKGQVIYRLIVVMPLSLRWRGSLDPSCLY